MVAADAAAADRRRRWRRRTWKRRRHSGGRGRRPAGFGVRVVHSGVWGFASQPHRHRGRDQAHHARRGGSRARRARSRRRPICKLAQVPKYIDELRHADGEGPAHRLADRQAGVGAGDRRQGEQGEGRDGVNVIGQLTATSGATSRRARAPTSSRSCTRRRRT